MKRFLPLTHYKRCTLLVYHWFVKKFPKPIQQNFLYLSPIPFNFEGNRSKRQSKKTLLPITISVILQSFSGSFSRPLRSLPPLSTTRPRYSGGGGGWVARGGRRPAGSHGGHDSRIPSRGTLPLRLAGAHEGAGSRLLASGVPWEEPRRLAQEMRRVRGLGAAGEARRRQPGPLCRPDLVGMADERPAWLPDG
jgi:hypothetical protein